MQISVFELFSIGIGPSSSHTVGPMRAARSFGLALAEAGLLDQVTRITVELYGSLGATAGGHGSDRAVILGLLGADPVSVDPDLAAQAPGALVAGQRLALLGRHTIDFVAEDDLRLRPRERLPRHPNGMRFCAYDAADHPLLERVSYSIGGGFVLDEETADLPSVEVEVPYAFNTAADLLKHCERVQLPISEVVFLNECARRSEEDVRAHLAAVSTAMRNCIKEGLRTDGTLPGALGVRRRAASLVRGLQSAQDPLSPIDWTSAFAIAVNEQNAAGRRVVTAPTNGAAGIVPAVLEYATRFCDLPEGGGLAPHERYLLTAAAVGALCKLNASISGAEVGCQGEVGSASAMAAAGLSELLGATPTQVENAAEIALEHNLGLTCDPIGGLVQIPCIERNAIGSVKAIAAARLATLGDGRHFVSLDQVIETMRATGADMASEYKETSMAGLAVNVPDC